VHCVETPTKSSPSRAALAPPDMTANVFQDDLPRSYCGRAAPVPLRPTSG
jgi:hypothetical protein